MLKEVYYVYFVVDMDDPYSLDDLFAMKTSVYPSHDELEGILKGAPEGYEYVRVIKAYTLA